MIENVASWKRDFGYDLSNYRDCVDFRADIAVIRLGENVTEERARSEDLEENLSSFARNFHDAGDTMVFTDEFSPNDYKDAAIERTAASLRARFVSIRALWSDPSNAAFGFFDHQGVASHPSDKGMRAIAEILAAELSRIRPIIL